MKRLGLILAAWVTIANPVGAQTLLQSGPWTPGHVPAFYPLGAGSSVPLVVDSGAAGGMGAAIQGISEGLFINPTTPTGPLATNICDYSANPMSAAAQTNGYYWLCLSPNSGGAGLIAFGAVGATPIPLVFNVNGSTFPVGSNVALAFPAAVSGGVSGGIPYFSSTTALSASPALTAGQLVVGGGAGGPPSTITTGTGVATALGVATGTAGSFVVNGGAGGTPSSINLANATNLPPASLAGLGTGVATALGVNVGSSGAFVVNGGALGAPSGGTATNITGLPISTGVSGLGTNVATALGVNLGSTGAVVKQDGSITTGDCLSWGPGAADSGAVCGGLTVGTSTISGGTNGYVEFDNAGVLGEIATTGSGNVVRNNSPTLITPALGTPASGTLTNAIGLPLSTGITGFGTGVATALGNATNASGGVATLNGTPTSGNCVQWSSSGLTTVSQACATLVIGTTATSGGAAGQIMYDTGSAVTESSGLTFANGSVTARGFIAGVTTPTDGGAACTASSIVGGSSGGKFVTTTGCSSNAVTLNLATAPHGWACGAPDITTPADTLKESAYTASSVTFTGTTANNDVIVYHCTGF